MIFKLGDEAVTLEDVVNVARHNAIVEFSSEYIERVNRSREFVEKCVREERVVYGVTTGFGQLSTEIISSEYAQTLQRNIVLSHATSVGAPMKVEQVRAIMFMMLQNAGLGYSGIRLETLKFIQMLLNSGITPFVPDSGSVGYLSVEGHVATVLIGEGRAFYQNELLSAKDALAKIGEVPIVLSSKEGLVLLNGATSPTALASLALFDMLKACKSADIIASLTFESLRGTLKAFDERAMNVKQHQTQKDTAHAINRILASSQRAQNSRDYRLQDALSLRGIPQLHGAVKKSLYDAKIAIENELNSCSDNPIVITTDEQSAVISSCNCDASYVGLEIDSASIASTMIAKMSERRNYRLIDGNLSEFPWFMIKNPGLNSGLMIPQYTQAGLLNEMRMLSMPAVIDSVPTSGGQEDYVSMGYNSAKKANVLVEKLEYVLAIELLSVYQSQQFIDKEGLSVGDVSKAIFECISESVPMIDNDLYLYPLIESLKEMIHEGKLVGLTENIIGELK